MELKELYQEIILDHAKILEIKESVMVIIMMQKHIIHYVVIKFIYFLKLENKDKISRLSFEGDGCAISLASASILTDIIKGKDISFSKKLLMIF